MREETRRREAETGLTRISCSESEGLDRNHEGIISLIVGLLQMVIQRPSEKLWYAVRAICNETQNEWVLGAIPRHVQENLNKIEIIMYDAFNGATQHMLGNLECFPITVRPNKWASSEEIRMFNPEMEWAKRQASRYVAGLRSRYKKGSWDGEIKSIHNALYPDDGW